MIGGLQSFESHIITTVHARWQTLDRQRAGIKSAQIWRANHHKILTQPVRFCTCKFQTNQISRKTRARRVRRKIMINPSARKPKSVRLPVEARLFHHPLPQENRVPTSPCPDSMAQNRVALISEKASRYKGAKTDNFLGAHLHPFCMGTRQTEGTEKLGSLDKYPQFGFLRRALHRPVSFGRAPAKYADQCARPSE